MKKRLQVGKQGGEDWVGEHNGICSWTLRYMIATGVCALHWAGQLPELYLAYCTVLSANFKISSCVISFHSSIKGSLTDTSSSSILVDIEIS